MPSRYFDTKKRTNNAAQPEYIRTPMQWLQSTYTIRHNVRHRKRGHLFQGRMTNAWIAGKLCMGDPSRVSRYCSQASGRNEVRKLAAKLETSIGKA